MKNQSGRINQSWSESQCIIDFGAVTIEGIFVCTYVLLAASTVVVLVLDRIKKIHVEDL